MEGSGTWSRPLVIFRLALFFVRQTLVGCVFLFSMS